MSSRPAAKVEIVTQNDEFPGVDRLAALTEVLNQMPPEAWWYVIGLAQGMAMKAEMQPAV